MLITDATSGLGRYLAQEFAQAGWDVLVHGRDHGRVGDLCADLGGARGYVADPAWLADVTKLAARIRAEAPRLDVLVNNAGIGFGAPRDGRQVSGDRHELRFAVNYLAPVLLTRLLVPALPQHLPPALPSISSPGIAPASHLRAAPGPPPSVAVLGRAVPRSPLQ